MAEVTRNDVQHAAGYAWYSSARKNTVILGTGMGKSKLAMDIMDRLFQSKLINSNSSVLLLTNSEKLRDENWKDDFEKWGRGHYWEMIESECYQTAYKWSGKHFDFVISDEIDFSCTIEYMKFYQNNTYHMLLGLTGFVDQSKRAMLNSIAPPVMVYSTQEGQEAGLLNRTQLVVVEYDLSLDKSDVEVKYKTKDKTQKSFTQSENDAYLYLDARCNILTGKIDKLEKDPVVLMGFDEKATKELKSMKYSLDKAIKDRAKLLANNKAGVSVAKYVISKVLENPQSKVLIFSNTKAQADKISAYTFHGDNKEKNNLAKLNSGEIRALGVCKAVDRGVNLTGVNNLIMEGYDSSQTKFQQRHGRGCRLEANQTMFLYVLIPYFYKQIDSTDPGPKRKTWVRRPTKSAAWAQEMMTGYNFPNPIKIYISPNDIATSSGVSNE